MVFSFARSFLLNPTQIYKLLSMYRDDETEKPIAHQLLGLPSFFANFSFRIDLYLVFTFSLLTWAWVDYVSKKVLKANEELAVNSQGHAPFSAPAPRVIASINNYLPKDMSLTVLSYIQPRA